MKESFIKPIMKINHKNYKYAFLFNAFYSAIIFATLFIVNDIIDDYILDRREKQYGTKLLIHASITFAFTYVLVIVLWNLFGWGKTFFG